MSVRIHLAWVLAVLVLAGACGPKVASDEEWMVAVYSLGQPEQCGNDKLHQYHVNADHTFVDVAVGVDGWVGRDVQYRWEARDLDTLAVIPAEGEQTVGETDKEWRISREGRCGPYQLRVVERDGDLTDPLEIQRAALCVREDQEYCLGYRVYYCDGPPEPCEDNPG